MEIILNIVLGISCIVVGIGLINYYQNLVKQNKQAGLSFGLRNGGIGLIMIGVALIIRSFMN